MNNISINNYIKKNLSTKRYEHCIRVMQKALEYADIYHVDKNIVGIVAMSHDMTKEFSDLENRNYVINNNLDKSLLLSENRSIVHGYVAADMLEKEFNFTSEMADAVRYHTTGRKDMTMLDKIIFMADKTEELRKFSDVDIERSLAKKNLDKAMLYSLKNTINYLETRNKPVNLLTYDAVKYFEKISLI